MRSRPSAPSSSSTTWSRGSPGARRTTKNTADTRTKTSSSRNGEPAQRTRGSSHPFEVEVNRWGLIVGSPRRSGQAGPGGGSRRRSRSADRIQAQDAAEGVGQAHGQGIQIGSGLTGARAAGPGRWSPPPDRPASRSGLASRKRGRSRWRGPARMEPCCRKTPPVRRWADPMSLRPPTLISWRPALWKQTRPRACLAGFPRGDVGGDAQARQEGQQGLVDLHVGLVEGGPEQRAGRGADHGVGQFVGVQDGAAAGGPPHQVVARGRRPRRRRSRPRSWL